jgi:hypothetical protein
MTVAIHGLERLADTCVFAFLVVRLHDERPRPEVAGLLRALAPLIAEADAFISEWESDALESVRIVAMPWATPADDATLAAQRALVERVDGIDSVWFFHTGDDPPEIDDVAFPVDHYPEIIDEHDWQDFGIAVKLAGEALPGQSGVLFGFHSLWLTPYDEQYRNAATTFDREHNSVHFWVDRFAVAHEPAQQVHHLLWVIAQLGQVLPVVHARFAGASETQKYAALAGDTAAFVLGGNPLLPVYAGGGEDDVDAWIARQTTWAPDEVAAMLRELAIEIVTDESGEADDDVDAGEARAARDITESAGEILTARASADLLHPRAADQLLPVLDQPGRYELRRHAAVAILGALRYKPAVASLVRILETTRIKNSLDSIGKEDLIAATASALGDIGDPAAIPALAGVVAAVGTHNDKPRPAAANALASCLAATPEPRVVPSAIFDSLLTTISERNDGELNAETHFAYGRLARMLPPERRAEVRRTLADADTARDDAVAMLARQAALVLASPTTPIAPPPRELQPLLRECLTSLDYDHEYTVRNLRVALRAAAIVPDLVDPESLVWLTRFGEADIRRSAHALLAQLGCPMAEAPTFDHVSVQAVGDQDLVRLISEPHVVNRAALIGEAGRRGLAAAKRAVIDACHDVVGRARQGGENLLDPDTRTLEAAVAMLRDQAVDADITALFDRMLRHPNVHVKWELIDDARGEVDAPDHEDPHEDMN